MCLQTGSHTPKNAWYFPREEPGKSNTVFDLCGKVILAQEQEKHKFNYSGLSVSRRQKLYDKIQLVKETHLRLSIVGSINVDCSNGVLDPMTNAFIQMSGVFAELELRIIRARVVSGMRNAAAKGAKIGRPQTSLDELPADFLRHYPAYQNGSFNLTE